MTEIRVSSTNQNGSKKDETQVLKDSKTVSVNTHLRRKPKWIPFKAEISMNSEDSESSSRRQKNLRVSAGSFTQQQKQQQLRGRRDCDHYQRDTWSRLPRGDKRKTYNNLVGRYKEIDKNLPRYNILNHSTNSESGENGSIDEFITPFTSLSRPTLSSSPSTPQYYQYYQYYPSLNVPMEPPLSAQSICSDGLYSSPQPYPWCDGSLAYPNHYGSPGYGYTGYPNYIGGGTVAPPYGYIVPMSSSSQESAKFFSPTLSSQFCYFDGLSTEKRNPTERPRSKESKSAKLARQLNYYFSVDNLCKDLYLREHMDDEGYVNLRFIFGFSKVKNLVGRDFNILRETARNMQQLQIVGDGRECKVRIKDGWEKWVTIAHPRKRPSRTVV
ncbi:hypothetical protein FOA43_001371 [Brettanomyces nanus]|uniref:HTH La-type RNA-binding domain-containing protein n=1 Tax=Eeniella nana TaxID=13502 RepID=A0A875RX88_EENNA|nr:uncharacterized protein FOA43_001371 [Brettanomyces nanus]QPG74051.1 hypothetical protein FOA43_001371 [Brettanomyces nanus]